MSNVGMIILFIVLFIGALLSFRESARSTRTARKLNQARARQRRANVGRQFLGLGIFLLVASFFALFFGRGVWAQFGRETATPTPTMFSTIIPTVKMILPSQTVPPSATTTVTASTTRTFTARPINKTLTIVLSTLTPTSTKTFTPSATFTATSAPTITFTPSFTATRTRTSTSAPTKTYTPSSTATYTLTASRTSTITSTSLPTRTFTPTATRSATFTFTPSRTPTFTLTPSSTATPSFTPSRTSTATPTKTSTPTFTKTFTPTSTATSTATSTRTRTPIPTSTYTFTPTRTSTPTLTPTATNTPSPTITATPAWMKIKIYFTDGIKLRNNAPPFEVEVVRSVRSNLNPVGAALDEYFRGPTSAERQRGLTVILNGFTGYKKAEFSNGILRVYLTGTCQAGQNSYNISQPLIKTLKQFAGIVYVKLYDQYGATRDSKGRSDSYPLCLDPLTPTADKTPTP